MKLLRIVKKSLVPAGIGLASGLLNGLLGAGGGMMAVPLLQRTGVAADKAHATSIAVILPLSILSAGLYLGAGKVDFSAAWPYLPGGLAGAAFGAWLLPRVPAKWLKRLFGILMIYSAVRIFMK